MSSIASLIHDKCNTQAYDLIQAAKVIWRFDPSFEAYYQKKQSENKHFYVILGHIQTKLVRVIYSVLKNNLPYSPR